jgi:hypothetical protein
MDDNQQNHHDNNVPHDAENKVKRRILTEDERKQVVSFLLARSVNDGISIVPARGARVEVARKFFVSENCIHHI